MPMLCNIAKFEKDLCKYIDKSAELKARAEHSRSKEATSWLGLLFAVLASGTQFSSASVSMRFQKSRTYGKLIACPLLLAKLFLMVVF